METLLTISLVGLVVGFIFSIPVAGPVSILITSHAIKGEMHFALVTALGAAIIDFLYCFIAVFGFTHLYILYRPIIPYTLLIGTLFLIFLGYRIMHMKLDLEATEPDPSKPRLRKRGRFLTGLMVNFLNPSLFFGWLTSSFVVMSFVASLGLNIGGLNTMLENNVDSMKAPGTQMEQSIAQQQAEQAIAGNISTEAHPFWNSLAYAFFVALGTVVWFYNFSKFLVHHRKKLKIEFINKIIHTLGFALWGFGAYLTYTAIKMIMA